MVRRVQRDDRGDVPLWSLLATMSMVLLVIVVTVVIQQGGASPLHVLVLNFAAFGGLAVMLAMGVAGAADWVGARRQRNLVWRMGPVLGEWLNKERVDDAELKWWRKCERSGVSVQLAREWANDGTPYPLLVASPGLAVERRSVRALAAVMRDVGAWDGHDRRALVDLIGFHVDFPAGGHFPVLGRWLAFPPETVRMQVVDAIARADVDHAFIVAQYRVMAAAEATLYDLEEQHGIKGHRTRPQRPVHPSWLAHVG